MRRARLFPLVVSFVVLAGCGREPSSSVSDVPAGVQPPTAPSGWRVADGPTFFTDESLFEYLNGGAPMYLDYGFKGLTQVRYQRGDDPFASVTLDFYDMGSKLGAFGLYRSIRPHEVSNRNWGAEGYRSGTVAASWSGAIYVQGEADDDRPELVEGLERLIAHAIDGAGGTGLLPTELSALPVGGRVRGSERYVAADLFGHAFLPGGFVATYTIGEDEFEIFFSTMPGPVEAGETLDLLRAFEQQHGEIGAEVADLGDGGFRFFDPGLGDGLFARYGNHIVGAHGSANADGYVRELVELLPRN